MVPSDGLTTKLIDLLSEIGDDPELAEVIAEDLDSAEEAGASRTRLEAIVTGHLTVEGKEPATRKIISELMRLEFLTPVGITDSPTDNDPPPTSNRQHDRAKGD